MKEWAESQTGVRTRKYPGWVFEEPEWEKLGESLPQGTGTSLNTAWQWNCLADVLTVCIYLCFNTLSSLQLQCKKEKEFLDQTVQTAVFLCLSCVCMCVCLHVCLPHVAGGPPSQWTTKDTDRHTNTQTLTGLSLRISIDIYSKLYPRLCFGIFPFPVLIKKYSWQIKLTCRNDLSMDLIKVLWQSDVTQKLLIHMYF